VFRQEPTTGERVGGALGAIGGAAAVTAAESPELIPVVAPITAKAGAMAGRAVEERLLRKQSSNGNPPSESCWVYGWNTGINFQVIDEMLKSMSYTERPNIEAKKEEIRRVFKDFLLGSINSGCKHYDKDKVTPHQTSFLDALNKEDWLAARTALREFIFSFLY
jgi:hypothetical protein